MQVKALILRASGINCDVETERAFTAAGADAERVHIRRFLDGERQLDEIPYPGDTGRLQLRRRHRRRKSAGK